MIATLDELIAALELTRQSIGGSTKVVRTDNDGFVEFNGIVLRSNYSYHDRIDGVYVVDAIDAKTKEPISVVVIGTDPK